MYDTTTFIGRLYRLSEFRTPTQKCNGTERRSCQAHSKQTFPHGKFGAVSDHILRYFRSHFEGIPVLRMSDETAILAIRIRFLGSNDVHELSLPSDVTTESLAALVRDFPGCPAGDIRVIFGGRCLSAEDSLASIGIRDGQTISVAAKPLPRAADPPPPPPAPTVAELRQRLLRLQQTLADAGGAAGDLQVSLFFARNSAPEIRRFSDAAEALLADLAEFNDSPFAAAPFGPRDDAEEAIDAGPAISDEDRAEMEKVAPTLAGYAAENRLADVYAASDIHKLLLAD
jgi:hypothetical protein